MKPDEILNEYLDVDVSKSGFMMTGGKSIYLYDNLCCDAECLRILLKSEKHDIDAAYSEDFLLTCTGTKLTAYCGFRRVLKLSALILEYRITLPEGELYGIFTGGSELPAADIRFTDKRITQLTDYLMSGGKQCSFQPSGKFTELEKAVESGELRTLCRLYSNGRPIAKGEKNVD